MNWARAALTAIVLTGLVLLTLTLHDQASALDRAELPSPARLAVVVLCALAGQVSFGLMWDRLLPGVEDRAALAWSFHGSQPAKYVPIGVAQPISQVGLLRGTELGTGTLAVGWVTQIVLIVASGLFLGAGLVFTDHPGPLRVLAVVGILAPVLVYRPVPVAALRLLRRLSPRVPTDGAVAPQPALVLAFALGCGALALQGTAFALLVGAGRPASGALVLAYALSAGLSVGTPLPAGLGVREALLVATAGLAATTTLSAALVLRVVILVAELGLFVATFVWHRRRDRSAPLPAA